MTEQIAHAEISVRANAKAEALRDAERAEETHNLPEGWEAVHSGHYPPDWVENRQELSLIDPVVLALAALRRLANQADLSDVQRRFFHDAARRAYDAYAINDRHARAYIDTKNAESEAKRTK